MSNSANGRWNMLRQFSLGWLFYVTSVAAVACWWIQLHRAADWPLYPGDFALVGILLCISSAVDIEQPELSIQLFLLGMAFLLIQSASDNLDWFASFPMSCSGHQLEDPRPIVRFGLLRPVCMGVIMAPILYRRRMSLNRFEFVCSVGMSAAGFLSVAVSGWGCATIMVWNEFNRRF